MIRTWAAWVWGTTIKALYKSTSFTFTLLWDVGTGDQLPRIQISPRRRYGDILVWNKMYANINVVSCANSGVTRILRQGGAQRACSWNEAEIVEIFTKI